MKNLGLAAFVIASLGAVAPGARADVPARMGSGNINDLKAGAGPAGQFAILNTVGAGACRIPIYPYDYYWGEKKPTPERADALMVEAHAAGITPVVLFEYYTNMPTPIGDETVWHDIGKAFADRFKPNSDWWLTQGVKDFGVTVYAACNEADLDKPAIAPQLFHDALKGLGDGVHESENSLKVLPGGFAGPNSRSDYTCAGLGPVIADLENDGTLDGIDLHTYNGKWAPLDGHRFSAQHDFEAVKKAWGVTRDVNFYCTEFNYQQTHGEPDQGQISDGLVAQYLLTMIWDNLGVVGNDGQDVSRLALCWNLFNDVGHDPDYGMTQRSAPWVPTARGRTYQLVAKLTAGCEFEQADPNQTGTFVLSGPNRVVWVWQDRPNWTTFPGTTCLITGIPKGATKLEVYGWDGLRTALDARGHSSLRVDDLPGNETYMFVANAADHGALARAVQP